MTDPSPNTTPAVPVVGPSAPALEQNDGSETVPRGYRRHINRNGAPGPLVPASARISVTATVGEGAKVGEWATVGEGAKVGEGATVGARAKVGEWATVGEGRYLHGNHGGYPWDLYIGADGLPVLRYGCEVHPLSWWHEADLPALSIRHAHDADHARWTLLVRTLADAQWAAIKDDVERESAAGGAA
jgi:carbonic anhydrase/acetyltransferase-like protein (isoleucine patch superfamily)